MEWAPETVVREKNSSWHVELADRIAVLRARHNIGEIALQEAMVLLNGASVERDPERKNGLILRAKALLTAYGYDLTAAAT